MEGSQRTNSTGVLLTNSVVAGASALGVLSMDDSAIDYKALYLQEAEKNKQLLQWIMQLQSNLSMRLQKIEPRLPIGSAAPDDVLPAMGATKLEHASTSAPSPSSSAGSGEASKPDAGRHCTEDKSVDMRSQVPPPPPPPPLRAHEQIASCGVDSAQMPSEHPSNKRGKVEEGTGNSNEERASHAVNKTSALQGRGAEGNMTYSSRLVSKQSPTNSNSTSQQASPSLSHRGSNTHTVGQENMLSPEIAHVDLARTTCSKCGQGFAFCAAFLSRHDFLVMPCPKCRTAAAIPPTPLAPTANASKAVHWQDTGSGTQMGVARDGFL